MLNENEYAYDKNGFPLGLRIYRIGIPETDDYMINSDGKVMQAKGPYLSHYPILTKDNPYDVWNLLYYAKSKCPKGYIVPENFYRCALANERYISNSFGSVIICSQFTHDKVIVFEKQKSNKIVVEIENALPETEGIEDATLTFSLSNGKAMVYNVKAKHFKV